MNNFRFAITAVALLWASAACAAENGTVLKPDDIKAEPFRDAATVASLVTGDKVSILKKEGGWLKIKSSKGNGWVRMLSVRKGEARKGSGEASGLLALSSGRAGTGTVVATTGIRGLDSTGAKLNDETLKAAKFNESEVRRAESNAVSKDKARQFAEQGGLQARQVEYLPAAQ